MNTIDKKAVIIFAKFPSEGNVKTRLALGAGNETALFFYRECCDYIFGMLENFNDKNTEVFLFYSVVDNEEQVRQWVGKPFKFIRQSSGNLGDKMRSAFNFLFDEGYGKVLIIGTDIPDLTENDLSEAFNRLNDSDIVIGPADDGGYYLLGMNRRTDELFADILWSSETVLDSTIEVIKRSGKSFFLLDKLHDIDDLESLKNWTAESGGNVRLKEKMKNLKFIEAGR